MCNTLDRRRRRTYLTLTCTFRGVAHYARFAPRKNELLVWIIRTAAAGRLYRGPAADHTGWYADCPAHARLGASLPEATPDNGMAWVGLVPASGNRPQDETRGPAADHESGPGQGTVPDHADQDADQIRAGSAQAGTARDESETIAGAVAAYRASLQTGRPLSERKLAGMFGKTSRRWAQPHGRSPAEPGTCVEM